MSNVTVMQVVEWVIKFAAFCGAVGVITGLISKYLTKKVSDILKPLNERMTNIEMNSIKNYLVMVISRVESGEAIAEVEKERFFESYERYRELGGNSYIKAQVDKLESSGRL